MCRAGLVLLDFIFGCRVSSGHPSHCRPSLVLIDLFLLLSPLVKQHQVRSAVGWVTAGNATAEDEVQQHQAGSGLGWMTA